MAQPVEGPVIAPDTDPWYAMHAEYLRSHPKNSKGFENWLIERIGRAEARNEELVRSVIAADEWLVVRGFAADTPIRQILLAALSPSHETGGSQ
ncbi:MAG TPA: hypothetical protein VK638_59095 [Edaphobacter sp.]|nr:hypothetical protein [Edaphobacter sp.]